MPTVHINIRIDDRMVERLDALGEAMKDAPAYVAKGGPTRSDIMREALAIGVVELEEKWSSEESSPRGDEGL